MFYQLIIFLKTQPPQHSQFGAPFTPPTSTQVSNVKDVNIFLVVVNPLKGNLGPGQATVALILQPASQQQAFFSEIRGRDQWWMRKKSLFKEINLSKYLFTCLSIQLSVSIYLSISIFLALSLSLSLAPSISLSLSVSHL